MGNNATNQTRVIHCYNCRGEGHMARQCTQPKRPRNSEWFKEKMLLVQAQESGVILDEDQIAFLVDLGVAQDLDTQTILPINAAFRTVDLDLHKRKTDDEATTIARQCLVPITSAMINDFYLRAFENEIHTLKLRLSKNMENNKTLTTTMDVLKKETKEKEDKYIEEIVDLEKKKKDLDNIVYEDFDKGLHIEINEMKAVFNQMEFEFEQCSLIISQDLVHIVVNSYAAIVDYVNMEKSYLDEYNECLELKAELSKKNEMLKERLRSNKPCQNQNAPEFQEFFKINNLKAQLKGKDTTISNIKKHIANLKGKGDVDCSESINNLTVIAPGMYKLDLQPFSSTLRKNKEVPKDYLKVTKEHADTLRGIIEQARALEPSDNTLDYASSKTKSWLRHRRLSHLNFGTINELAKQGLVRGLPKLKYEKEHLCSACSLGSMRIESINEKKYILVIVYDYSWFTWVKFLRLKDEAPEFIIKFLKKVQVRLNATVKNIHTDNGTEFVNRTLKTYYEDAPLYLWAEAVATTCYTQNRSLIRKRHNKTPYELLHDRKPDLKYFHIFGALCYPTNDSEDLGKLKPKADIGIFIGYSTANKAYRIYNRQTRMIMETIHVNFDKLTAMASEQFGSGLELLLITPGTISLGLAQNSSSSTTYVPPTKKDWDILFQPMFDEYFQSSPSVVSHVLPAVALISDDTTDTPSSTVVDQDAPSVSTLPTTHETQSLVISQGLEE
ncbi:retrovirus-related pol polyprotein from transposon TNT 1-94 [Tanacetum coccineum]